MTTPKTLADAFKAAKALDAPLSQRLALYATWLRELSPAVTAAYDRIVARVSAIETEQIGPRVGDAMPPFLLPDQDGHLVDLESLIRAGPLVISFNRGHWCSFCRMELCSISDVHPEIVARGADIVAIVPEREEFTKKLVRDNALPFRVLSDVDLDYTFALDLAIWAGPEIKDLYLERKLDLTRFQGNDGWFLPIPATFVVGGDGTVAARYIDPDFRRRMEVDAILAALKAANGA